ncbi:myb-like DNA-binding protein [Thraustotheca clavata]|uniref:Myb-like DNA-binding protein n=1 Tax=Thraustotheca clavata TaxID=74557 RepID=A0A1V9Y532_9STRA|nr:myb-like DNA-binding protein [Thraustotheca clavata]
MATGVKEEVPPGEKGQEESFGDVLNALLASLPSDASSAFLRCLAGLTAEESNDLAKYVVQLKEEKKFRVIQAMADSSIPAKKKFLGSLREKFERLKAQAAAEASRPPLTKSNSRQSSLLQVTPEDINSMNHMLDNAHIGESELRLRDLEDSLKKKNEESTLEQKNSLLMMTSKRERPNSNWELVKGEAAPTQKACVDEDGSGDAEDDDDDEDDEDDDEETPSSTDKSSTSEASSMPPLPEISPEDAPSTKRWTKAQDNALKESVQLHGEKNWKAIAERVPGRNHAQCLQRWRKVLKPGLVKGHWSFEEDKILEHLVKQSCNNWGQIAEQIPGRTPKQCRERWRNHLDPSINKGPYAAEEDKVILSAQARLGNKWSQIAQLLPGRTEDSVKIRWKSLKQNPERANHHRRLTAGQALNSGMNPHLQHHMLNEPKMQSLHHPTQYHHPPQSSMMDGMAGLSNTNGNMNDWGMGGHQMNYGMNHPHHPPQNNYLDPYSRSQQTQPQQPMPHDMNVSDFDTWYSMVKQHDLYAAPSRNMTYSHDDYMIKTLTDELDFDFPPEF